jgi:AraC-like DNA-binding protein
MNHVLPATESFSDYREYAAPLPLAGHLLCFWTQSITSRGVYRHRVLPDACLDIVFINDDPAVVVGPWTSAFTADLPAGAKIMGARWHPGRAPALLGLPALELLNQSVPLNCVWNRATNLQFARVADQPDLAARRTALGAALLTRLGDAAPVDLVVDAGIRWLASHPRGRAAQLSRIVGLSNRHLQRRFCAAVGFGPKMFQSVLRFQRLLNLAGTRSTGHTLADFAVDAGYADQAHMTREVQRFSGSSPSTMLRSAESTLRLSNFFDSSIEPKA